MGCVSNNGVITGVSGLPALLSHFQNTLVAGALYSITAFYKSQFLLRSGGPRAIASVRKATPSANS